MPTCRNTTIQRLSLLALGLLLSLSGCGPHAEQVPVVRPVEQRGATGATPQRSATPQPAASPRPVEPGTSRRVPLPLDSLVRTGNLSIRVTSVAHGDTAWRLIAETNQRNDPPAAGHAYLLVSIEVGNLSTQPHDLTAILDLRLTGDRNILYPAAGIVTPQPLRGELAAGARLEGQLVFQIAANEGDLMLRISERFPVQQVPVFFVAVSEGASLTPNRALLRIRPTSIGIQRSEPATLGQMVTTADWQMTVLEVVRGLQAAALAAEAYQFNDPPAEGMEYVAVRVRARYIDTAEPDDPVLIDDSYMSITGERRVVYKRPSLIDPVPELLASLFPGGTVEGWQILSVAQGEQQLVLIFEPFQAFADQELRFVALE